MAGLAVAATPAAAQNGYAFLDAAGSAVHYGAAVVEPQLACSSYALPTGPDTAIISAQPIAAADGVPAHCRITGVIALEIRFEINLPQRWNRRFYMFGNGGFAGETPETGARPLHRAQALRQGFAVASTNTGHDAQVEPLASFAWNLRKRIDYAFRAVHMVVLEAKQMAAGYYARPVTFSYWDGCSTGGRQGLISAQRYPQDFDGILAGAPVLNFVDTVTQSLWIGRMLAEVPLTSSKMKVVADAVYARCDARDGLKDGLIDDPRKCDFDPARDVAQCAPGEDGDGCLTEAQARVIGKVYGGMISNGKKVHFGYSPGAEATGQSFTGSGALSGGWDRWLIPPAGGKSIQHSYGESFVKHFAFAKPDANYDANAFDFDKDLDKLAEVRGLLDATDPSLGAFRARGGRLLMYFGWADQALPPLMGVDYYEKAVRANGPATDQFFRLFMVPGMFHCRGGVGTDRFDAMTALINWVENGVAPDQLIASRMENGRVVRTRPLCPYPQVARFAGTGNIDEAANFRCTTGD